MGSVDRVRETLQARGVEIAVHELEQSTRTAAMAAQAIGCPVGAIVKSLALLVDGNLALALAAGDRQVDLGKVARLAGATAVIISQE